MDIEWFPANVEVELDEFMSKTEEKCLIELKCFNQRNISSCISVKANTYDSILLTLSASN